MGNNTTKNHIQHKGRPYNAGILANASIAQICSIVGVSSLSVIVMVVLSFMSVTLAASREQGGRKIRAVRMIGQ